MPISTKEKTTVGAVVNCTVVSRPATHAVPFALLWSCVGELCSSLLCHSFSSSVYLMLLASLAGCWVVTRIIKSTFYNLQVYCHPTTLVFISCFPPNLNVGNHKCYGPHLFLHFASDKTYVSDCHVRKFVFILIRKAFPANTNSTNEHKCRSATNFQRSR